jgi:hypothetical protein
METTATLPLSSTVTNAGSVLFLLVMLSLASSSCIADAGGLEASAGGADPVRAGSAKTAMRLIVMARTFTTIGSQA